MRKVETREIGTCTYRVQQLKLRQGNVLTVWLLQRLGPALGGAVTGLGENEPSKILSGDFSKEGFREAVVGLCGSLQIDDLNWLVDRLRPSIMIQTPELRELDGDRFEKIGEKMWDEIFTPVLQFRVLIFALEVNLADFFGELGGAREFIRKLTTPADKDKSE
jgi:hypothetical protein